jgi:hypothetical protein
MSRKRKYYAKSYDDVPDLGPTRFQADQTVHAIDTGDLRRVEYVRKDHMICVQWVKTGTREWCHESTLCGPVQL